MTSLRLINPRASVYSSHRLTRAMGCLRAYAIALDYDKDGIEWDIKRNGTGAANGSALHLGLAHMYLHGHFDSYRNRVPPDLFVNNEIVKQPSEFDSWQNAGDIGAVQNMVDPGPIRDTLQAYYDSMFRIDRSRYQFIAIEEQYIYELPGIAHSLRMRSQRADLVVWNREDEKFYIMDHKKTWRLNAATELQFMPHGQFIGYSIIGHKTWGKRFGGVILNRIAMPYKGGKPKFDRTVISHPRSVILAYIESLRNVIEQISKYESQPWYKWPGTFEEQVCMGKYEPCPFMERCVRGR